MQHNKAGIIYSIGLLIFGLILIGIGLNYRRRYRAKDETKADKKIIVD
jgi:hypothetical protein